MAKKSSSTLARKSTSKRRGKKVDNSPKEKYDIPYFAHMKLDPNRYPTDHPQIISGKVQRKKMSARFNNSNWVGSGSDADDDSDATGVSLEGRSVQTGRKSRKRTAESSDEDRQPKRLRTAGGRPVVAKPVTFDMDSDDELIIQMKQARYLEKDISERLALEGRTGYMPKTIGTRWARIKKVLQDKQDQLLDQELTDWHDGDDDVLLNAIRKAESEVEKAKQQADDKMWKIVADEMKTMKPVVNFSKNACQARYLALQQHRAKPVPESIPDPDEKTLESIRRRREREEGIRTMTEDGVEVARKNLINNAWTSRMRNV